ncbi:hypothetical protein RRF57_011101 [Xylaria bambusicola]|uniref:Uncharacterized protein n=1 Tax=Xylaria bambusicola TaxID=326684 RepID=A0AAN7Z3C2_9PEZI
MRIVSDIDDVLEFSCGASSSSGTVGSRSNGLSSTILLLTTWGSDNTPDPRGIERGGCISITSGSGTADSRLSVRRDRNENGELPGYEER